VKFLVTKENMAYWCEQNTELPTRNDLVDAKLKYAVRPDLMPVFQQQATTMSPGLVKTCVTPAFSGINQALIDNMDQYLSNPSATADSVIQGLTSGINRALQSGG
jgi:multiple sugar transport system substrate-binding protein